MDGSLTDDGLVGGRCAACGRSHFPAAGWCPWCGADEVDVVTLSTTGTLWAWTAVVAPPPGYEGEVPFGFGVVELPADGLRIVTRLTEPDPSRLTLGQPVELRRVELPDGATTWAFGPVDGSGLWISRPGEISRARNGTVR
jgi:uncharacterized OB-fold protein